MAVQQGGIHDVHLGQMQGVDPQHLQRIAQAKAAQSSLAGMNNSPAMRNALRNSQPAPLEVQGRGAAATAPTILNAFASMAQQSKGEGRINAMEQQAQALRGQISEGSIAEQQSALQAADYQNKMDSQRRAQEITERKAAATLADERAVSRETTQAGYLISEPVEYVDKMGNRKFAGRSKGKGMVDPNSLETTDIEGWRKTSDVQEEALAGVQGVSAMSNTHKTDVVGAYEGIRSLDKIAKTASGLSDEARSQIDSTVLNTIIKAATPQAFEQLIQGQRFSPEVKKYLQEINEFSVKLRNDYFGSALTMNEQQIADAFLPSATGISLKDQMIRIDGLARTYGDSLKSVDNLYGSNTFKKAPDYTPWEDPESQAITNTVEEPASGLTQDETAELAALELKYGANPRVQP